MWRHPRQTSQPRPGTSSVISLTKRLPHFGHVTRGRSSTITILFFLCYASDRNGSHRYRRRRSFMCRHLSAGQIRVVVFTSEGVVVSNASVVNSSEVEGVVVLRLLAAVVNCDLRLFPETSLPRLNELPTLVINHDTNDSHCHTGLFVSVGPRVRPRLHWSHGSTESPTTRTVPTNAWVVW
jgi:hypothetical protein